MYRTIQLAGKSFRRFSVILLLFASRFIFRSETETLRHQYTTVYDKLQ